MRTGTLRAMVIDDEPLARDELRFLLGELDVEVVAEAANAAAALDALDDADVDVVFVDLRMPGPDGVALSESLLGRRADLAIVMVSAHDEGAVRAYDAGIVDYLLKPVRLERLQKACERARSRLPTRSADKSSVEDAPLTRLAVRRRGKLVVVAIEDIVWFEVKDELVWAVTETDRFALDLTLSAVQSRVSEQEFFRSHRGALVRLDRIAGIEPAGAGTYELHLAHPDAPRIPLARERARLLRELIPIAG